MRDRWPLVAACVGAVLTALLSAAPDTPPLQSPPGILLSRQLLESEHVRVGDTVTLATDAKGVERREFRVVGQFEPTPDPMRLGAVRLEARLHLPDLIDMVASSANPLDSETVDTVNVRAADGQSATDVSARLTTAAPGAIAEPIAGDGRRAEPFVVLERFHLAIAIVTVIASSVFLLALMLMLVDERRSTVAFLRLIGFRRSRILQHVLAEGVVIAIAGAFFGIVLSVLMEGGINRFFQWRYDTALVFVRITPGVALRSIAVSVPLGVAAVFASSWSLLRSEALSLTRR